MRPFAGAAVLAMALPILTGQAAQAHFLLQYTTEMLIERPGDLPMKLIFWHPFENGQVMDLAQPEQLFMIHREEKTDLMDRLQATSFTGAANAAAAWDATVPVKRSGDYVVVTVPQPYLEETEDKYIQQITKVVLNRNGVPTDWDRPVGLPTEILPLNKPYNIIAGGSFTGQVLSEGQPVAGAEIEVEYMAAEPDMATSAASAAKVAPMPGGAVVAISDANGYFTFAVPRAGYWGFAALGAGPVTEHAGKELSQDAVIWIRAHDLQDLQGTTGATE